MKTSKWVRGTIYGLCLCGFIGVLGSCELEPSYTFMATGHGSAISVECGWWLYADGPGTSLDPLNPEQGAAHHKVLVSDTYQGADWWKHKISANDALAGGPYIYVKTSSQTGGYYETKIVDEKGNRVDTMNYYSSGPESDATIGSTGGGGGGSTPYPPLPPTEVCAELYRQGLMPEHIFQADQLFGAYLQEYQNDVLIGYKFLDKPVVSLMRKSKTFTRIVNVVAEPWTYEMAYRMGARDEGNLVGMIIMDVGVPLCRTVGSVVTLARHI